MSLPAAIPLGSAVTLVSLNITASSQGTPPAFAAGLVMSSSSSLTNGRFRRTLFDTEAGAGRTIVETQRTLGETDAQ
jgi:hypothetical protein